MPAIRLFDAEAAPPQAATNARGLSPEMSLSAFVDAFVLPVWLPERHASEKTCGEYRKSIDYWQQFTGDPALLTIDDFTTSQFLQGLYALPGRAPRGTEKSVSPYTIRKHVTNVQTCLSLAGPRTHQHRKAQRLLEEIPYLERPVVDIGEVDDNFTLDEIGQIIDAARHMKRPRILQISPPAFWRTLVIVAYNTAERRGALLQVQQPKPGATSIVFPRGIRKGRKLTHNVPLNEHARAAIDAIRTDRELLFPWPHDIRWFARCWERLLRFAEIPVERRFGLHGLRKAAGTEMAAYSPLGGQLLLGHQQSTTFNRHYVGKQVKADAVERMPQPKRRRQPAADPSQRLLF